MSIEDHERQAYWDAIEEDAAREVRSSVPPFFTPLLANAEAEIARRIKASMQRQLQGLVNSLPSTRKDTTVKIKEKYYVGAPFERMSRGWRKSTIEEAVKHAQEIMERDGRDECAIVQIVRIVKRAKPIAPPVVVHKVL